MDEAGLRACTVRIRSATNRGSGFFVRPHTVLTCEHVVHSAGLHGHVDVGENDHGKVVQLDRDNDLALLKVTTSGLIAQLGMDFRLDDRTYSYGYPESAPAGDPTSGKVIHLDGLSLIKFTDVNLEQGMSGAPLLNLRTGKVCGMVKAKLDPQGGYAVPAEILRRFLQEPAVTADSLYGVPGIWRAQIEGFLTQYIGTSEFPAPFGGRSKNLEELNNWLATPEAPRYALISARGGIGKSALVAHWIELLQCLPTPFAIVYHPVSSRWETNSASAVFQSLSCRLAAVFSEPAPDTQDIDQLRSAILAYLDKANREHKPLLIVLDGLDEAAGWQADNRLFPPTRRGCVRVLVTTRPLQREGPGEWLMRLGWHPAGVARQFHLNLLDEKEVADVLRLSGNPLAGLAACFDVVAALFRKSGGDPLVLGLYVEKLREYVSSPESFRPAELESIEPGLAGFFRYWLNDQVRLWGDDRHNREPRVRTLLGLCSLAHGPLSRDDLRALAPDMFRSNSDLENTSADLSRFLITDARNDGHVLSHPRFANFIREDLLTLEECAEFERRFVDYGSRAVAQLTDGRSEHCPTYVVRWHTTHLTSVRASVDSFRPLLSLRWYQECERVHGTPAGFLSDLDRTWQAATGPAGVGTRIRVALLRSSLVSVGRNIVLELFVRCVQAGILNPTLAEVIARQQTYRTGLFIVALADHFAADRSRLLREAVQAARHSGDRYDRACTLVMVGCRLDGSDREKVLAEALEAARLIGNEYGRSSALIAVASQLEGSDRENVLREALENTRIIADDYFRAVALSEVASQVEDSEREQALRQALEAARHISADYQRAHALREIASCLKDSDGALFREIVQVAHHINDEYERSCALTAVASRVEGRDRDLIMREVLHVARHIGADHRRASALSAAASQLESSDREKVLLEAIAAARNVGSDYMRASALSAVASQLDGRDRHELLGEALEAARHTGAEYDRASVLSEVASKLETSDPELLREALATARVIGDATARAYALSAVASRLEGRDREELLRTALETARHIRVDYHRASALYAVASKMVGSDGELLQQVLDAVRGSRESNRVLCAIASQLEGSDRENLLREALKAAPHSGNESSRAFVLEEIASRLERSDGDLLREALNAAREIGDEGYRASALSAVASRLEGSDRERLLREALQATDHIEDPYRRACALKAVGSRLEGSDREKTIERALSAARHIDDQFHRARVLGEVASELPAGEDRDKVLREALEIVYKMSDKHSRAYLLGTIASAGLDAAGLHSVSGDIRSVSHHRQTWPFLRAVASHWPSYVSAGTRTSGDELASWIEPLSREHRSDLIHAIAELLPAIQHAGGLSAVIETGAAISEVTSWWT